VPSGVGKERAAGERAFEEVEYEYVSNTIYARFARKPNYIEIQLK